MLSPFPRRILAGVAILGVPALAAAQAPAPIAPSTPGVPASTNSHGWAAIIDRKHAEISSYVIGAGEGMDALLARPFRDPRTRGRDGSLPKFIDDPRALEDAPASRVRLTPVITVRDASGPNAGLQFSGKLRLPRLSDRLELIFDSEYDDRAVLNDLKRDDETRLQGDRDGIAALRYYLRQTLNFKASVDLGLKFKPEPVPRLSLRLRGYHDYEDFTARLTQTFFWETKDGFGERTVFDLEQQERHNYLRRLTTSVLWSEVSEGVQAGESFSYYKYLSRRRVAGFRVGVVGHLEPAQRVDNYTARLILRQRVHRDWLFLQIEPGIDWPSDRDYQETPFIRIALDIIFGDWGESSSEQQQ